jgi:hypothetical protein
MHYFSTAGGLRRLEKNLIHCQLVCSKSNVPCPETEPHPRTYYSNGTYHEVSEEHFGIEDSNMAEVGFVGFIPFRGPERKWPAFL